LSEGFSGQRRGDGGFSRRPIVLGFRGSVEPNERDTAKKHCQY
jgi:hypothetical protein